MKLTVVPEHFAAKPSRQQKTRQRWQQISAAVLMIVAMLLLLPLVLRAPRPNFVVPSTAVLILSTFLLFPLALFLSVAWHELGHLMTGKLVGFRFVLVTFGPLRIARQANGLHLSFIHNNVVQWQGRALSIPLSSGEHKWARILFLAGGPIATVSQLCLLLALNFVLQDEVVSYGWGLTLLWLLLAAVLLLPATAVPQKIGHIYTDAARIWQLWRGGEAITAQLALINLIEASLRGTTPAALDPNLLADALAAPSDSSEALVGHYIAHLRALEQGKIEDAAVFLDKTLALLQEQPPALRSPVIFASAAYFTARFANDSPQAEAWLALIQPETYNALALEVAQVLLRVRAQLLVQSGALAQAKATALQSLQLLERSVDLGSVALETHLLNEILASVEHVAPAPELPEIVRPALAGKRPFVMASARGFFRLALMVGVGLLLGIGWGELFPNRAVELYQRGVAHLERGEYEAAISQFDRAIDQDDQFAQAYWGRGDAWMSLGQYETAVDDFSRIIEMHPKTFPTIYAYRAAAYTQLGNFPAAIADYQALLALDPEEDLRRLALTSIHMLEEAQK